MAIIHVNVDSGMPVMGLSAKTSMSALLHRTRAIPTHSVTIRPGTFLAHVREDSPVMDERAMMSTSARCMQSLAMTMPSVAMSSVATLARASRVSKVTKASAKVGR